MEYTTDELVSVAKNQNAVFCCMAAEILCAAFPPAVIVVEPFQMYFVYRLGKDLRKSGLLLWVVAMLIPIVSLILLGILWLEARNVLKARGIKVGLVWADVAEVQAWAEQKQEPSEESL